MSAGDGGADDQRGDVLRRDGDVRQSVGNSVHGATEEGTAGRKE